MVELNSETDFVAKNEQFIALAEELAVLADATKPADAAALAATDAGDGATVAEKISGLAAIIGEKLELGRVAVLEGKGKVATYLHRRASDLPPAVGVLVEFEGDGEEEVARTVAMQVAAMRPRYLTREEVPADVVAKEREIAEADRPRGGQARGGAAARSSRAGSTRSSRTSSCSTSPRSPSRRRPSRQVLDEAGRHRDPLRAHRGRRLTPDRRDVLTTYETEAGVVDQEEQSTRRPPCLRRGRLAAC